MTKAVKQSAKQAASRLKFIT